MTTRDQTEIDFGGNAEYVIVIKCDPEDHAKFDQLTRIAHKLFSAKQKHKRDVASGIKPPCFSCGDKINAI